LIRLERLVKEKHSSLLETLINYNCKSFYNIDPWRRLALRYGRILGSIDLLASHDIVLQRLVHDHANLKQKLENVKLVEMTLLENG
jgi:hypothetical protein